MYIQRERERDRDREREREGQTERDREKQTKKHPANLIEATRKTLRSSETVMKRTASLRFAPLVPCVSGEEARDRLCLLVSRRTLSHTSDLKVKRDRQETLRE